MKSAVLATLILSACSSDDSPVTQGTVSSCDLTADAGYCLDFTAEAPAGYAQGNCDSASSTVGYHGIANESASCATSNRVGSCAANISGVDIVYRYYGPKFTTATAMTNCMGLGGTNGAGGTFTAN